MLGMSGQEQRDSAGSDDPAVESSAGSSVRQYLREHTNPPVFVVSALLTVAFVLWGGIAPGNVSAVADAVNGFITTNFDWLYIFAATGFVEFVLVVMMSRRGRIRQGPPCATPSYGRV